MTSSCLDGTFTGIRATGLADCTEVEMDSLYGESQLSVRFSLKDTCSTKGPESPISGAIPSLAPILIDPNLRISPKLHLLSSSNLTLFLGISYSGFLSIVIVVPLGIIIVIIAIILISIPSVRKRIMPYRGRDYYTPHS